MKPSKPKKPRPASPAEKTRAFAKAFPTHPRQDALIAAAVNLRAQELADGASVPTTTRNALMTACAELAEALQATIFPPSEDRLYFIWAAGPVTDALASHITQAWEDAAHGTYGKHQPQHWVSKK